MPREHRFAGIFLNLLGDPEPGDAFAQGVDALELVS